MFIAPQFLPGTASFGGADRISTLSASICPLLRTKPEVGGARDYKHVTPPG